MSLPFLIAATVFLPLLGALTSGLFVRTIGDTKAQLVTCLPMVLSALGATLIFFQITGGEPQVVPVLDWIESGDFSTHWALKVDVLTAIMLVLVTWVSAIVHVYSVGYMSHDHHKPRFMSYLSLFTFSMLMLVTADNFIQLFFGWEGVGLCSYLLIGFWFEKPSACAAAMKAFIVNRVGDFGFALCIAAVFLTFGSVDFATVFKAASEFHSTTPDAQWLLFGFSVPVMDTICLLLFMGAMGKSAQFLLHTWLPDAMEGPTPVSALIHAATMVTAGVFMLARCSPLFELAPTALMVVTYVGAITAFFAATVGLVQNDIKRVIAYSTCSQLGYMFFACGVSAYNAAVFHLFTHGFFKALLFLCAGSVIHAMSGEQDMRNMGGIWKKIPYTYGLMWVGSLALAGIPLFAGFYSKDGILEAAYAAGTMQGDVAFTLGIAAAFMTAFYSWRLLFMTFHGTPRASHEVMHHVHESPPIMLLPLVPLLLGAMFAGAIGYYAWGILSPSMEFWHGAITISGAHLKNMPETPSFLIEHAPLIAGVSGISLAFLFYIVNPALPVVLKMQFGGLYRFLLNKWYFDELYQFLFVRPALWLGGFLWRGVDVSVVDRLGPNGAAAVSRVIARESTKVQTGYLYHYAFAMIIGLLVLVSWLAYTVVR